MIYLGGKANNIEEGEKISVQKLMDKSAYRKFLDIVRIQNGDTDYVEDWADFKKELNSKDIVAAEDGFISELTDFGYASIELGCGRKKVE